MGYHLRRNLTGEDALQAGEYVTVESEHVSRTMIKVVIACPLCGAKKTLDERHVVDRAGRVTPAFACPHCPLIEWVELDSWGNVSR